MINWNLRLSVLLLLFTISISEVDCQDYRAIDQHAKSVPFQNDYKKATHELIAPFDREIDQVRAIFSWIAANISYDNAVLDQFRKTGKRGKTQISYSSEEEMNRLLREKNLERIDKMLLSGKGVCQDYSLLFQFMCEEAGIPCEYVRGFGRFSPSNIGKAYKKGNHAWNAVYVDNQWRLMDVTWSTGMGQDEDYGDGYFDVDPHLFIFSHHPIDEKWQLLEETVDVPTFSNLPFTYSGFLKYGVREVLPEGGTIKKTSILSVDMDVPEGERLLLVRARKPLDLAPVQDGDSYSFDLSKKRMAGKVTLAITNSGYIEPIMTMNIR